MHMPPSVAYARGQDLHTLMSEGAAKDPGCQAYHPAQGAFFPGQEMERSLNQGPVGDDHHAALSAKAHHSGM